MTNPYGQHQGLPPASAGGHHRPRYMPHSRYIGSTGYVFVKFGQRIAVKRVSLRNTQAFRVRQTGIEDRDFNLSKSGSSMRAFVTTSVSLGQSFVVFTHNYLSSRSLSSNLGRSLDHLQFFKASRKSTATS